MTRLNIERAGDRLTREILTDEQREAGFYLKEVEGFLYLYDRFGRRRATFRTNTALPEYVRDIAQRELERGKYGRAR